MGLSPQIADIITAAAQRYKQDPAYLQRQAVIESGGNPNAQNPRSSAGGLFQFTDGTASQYGLGNKLDPVAASDAAARLARDNGAYLTKQLGREPTPGELYLAHQQGMGGAAKLLANPDAPAVSLVGIKAVTGNGGAPDMTAAEFANRWIGKFDGSGPTMTMPGGSTASGRFTPSGVEGSSAPAPTMAMPTGSATDAPIDAAKIIQSLLGPAGAQAAAPQQPAAQPLQPIRPQGKPFDASAFYALLSGRSR